MSRPSTVKIRPLTGGQHAATEIWTYGGVSYQRNISKNSDIREWR